MSSGRLLDEAMALANKEYGEGTVIKGTDPRPDPPRLPFGVFAVDFATGGGCPLWGSTCLWGPEAGGKTSLALNAMAMAGRLCWRCFRTRMECVCSESPLNMRSVWEDAEGTLDREWAEALGCSPENYYHSLADHGEMHINIAEKALCADDCGLVVVDSIASLIPVDEFEAASEQRFMGNQARLVGCGVRKLKQRLIMERKRGHPCTIIFVNQMRKKIGELFGSPETMSGGHGMLHEFSLVLRVVQKALTENDKKKFVDGSVRKKDSAIRHSFTIKKEKIFTLGKTGEFIRLVNWVPELGLGKGVVDDHTTTLNYAKQYGLLEKKGDQWHVAGIKARKQADLLQYWRKAPDSYYLAQQLIIQAAKAELEAEGA